MNSLLEETVSAILKSGHTPKNIIFIGSEESGHECTWEQFEQLANIDYDSGYGGQEVAQDLIIVFSDGQKMWRGEYDGSEWWEYCTPFKRPDVQFEINTLKCPDGRGWRDLSNLNGVKL